MKEINGYINIARKAGYLIIGGDNIKKHTQKLYLILLDKDAGNSLKREMNFVAKNRNIPLCNCSNLSEMVVENCRAVAIKNKALSDSILKIIKGE